MPLNPKVQISETGIHGFCWFAGDDIKEGEWIWKKREPNAPNTDLFLTRAQIAQMDSVKREKYLNLCYQVDEDLHCGFDPDKETIHEELIEDYINHSCNGNTWYESDELLIAKQDIKKGQEITYDYCLTKSDPDWILAPKCLCGSDNCRGLVTGNDWKNPILQEEYGQHFEPHVLLHVNTPHSKSQDNKLI